MHKLTKQLGIRGDYWNIQEADKIITDFLSKAAEEIIGYAVTPDCYKDVRQCLGLEEPMSLTERLAEHLLNSEKLGEYSSNYLERLADIAIKFLEENK